MIEQAITVDTQKVERVAALSERIVQKTRVVMTVQFVLEN